MKRRTVLAAALAAFGSLAARWAVAAQAAPGSGAVDRFRPWTGPTPPLELQDLEGRKHTLADYQGKVVLLNFWATWCPPCRDEMPTLEKLRERLAGRPFAILGINYGESAARIKGFLLKTPVGFPILRDPRHDAITAWRVRTLPASFLVGPDGQVRRHVIGELDWSADDVVAAVSRFLP